MNTNLDGTSDGMTIGRAFLLAGAAYTTVFCVFAMTMTRFSLIA